MGLSRTVASIKQHFLECKRFLFGPCLRAPGTLDSEGGPSLSQSQSLRQALDTLSGPQPQKLKRSVLVEQRKYIIDQLLPTGEVHIIAGSSGAGKTTWLMQMLQMWSMGEPILDQESFPCSWAYIACDRGLQSVKTTMERVGVSFPGVYVDSMVDNVNLDTLDRVLERIAYKKIELLVLDGIGSVVPNGKLNDYDTVANFLKGLTRWCANRVIDWEQEEGNGDGYRYGERRTIIAITHSPKMKEKEHYVLGRDKIIGSTAWGAFAETIITIEAVLNKEGGAERELRQVSVMPRNAKNFDLQYGLDERGMFEQYTPTAGDSINVLLQVHFEMLKTNTLFTRQEILFYLRERGIEDARAVDKRLDRWFFRLMSEGAVEKVKKGQYRKIGELSDLSEMESEEA